jgi:hypothetical protein
VEQAWRTADEQLTRQAGQEQLATLQTIIGSV